MDAIHQQDLTRPCGGTECSDLRPCQAHHRLTDRRRGRAGVRSVWSWSPARVQCARTGHLDRLALGGSGPRSSYSRSVCGDSRDSRAKSLIPIRSIDALSRAAPLPGQPPLCGFSQREGQTRRAPADRAQSTRAIRHRGKTRPPASHRDHHKKMKAPMRLPQGGTAHGRRLHTGEWAPT
jgi:hypothetical protein